MRPLTVLGIVLGACTEVPGEPVVEIHQAPLNPDDGPRATYGTSETRPPPPVSSDPSWTVAVWMDGDNDLEAMVLPDLDELERAAVPGVSIVVQADRIEGYDDRDGDWTGARRYQMTYDTLPGLVSPVLADLGEVNMGGKRALGEFLLWAQEGWPSEHFALVFWDHGGGFWIASDDTNHSKLQMDGELQSALQQLVDARGGPLDVVAFDACNMAQWETAHTLRTLAHVMVGSEAWIGAAGFAYDAAFPALTAEHDAADFGDLLAWSGGEVNQELMESAIDLREVQALSDALDALAGAVLADETNPAVWSAARDLALGTDKLWDDFWLDLGSLADQIVATGDADLTGPALDVLAALDAAVISTYTSDDLAWSSGLTVYAETSVPQWVDSYGSGPWSHTQWDEMIVRVANWEQQ